MTVNPSNPYSQSTFSGLSLWLVPTKEDEIQKLKEGMQIVRDHINKGEKISVPFNPHVTLLGGLTGTPPWTADQVWKTLLESLQQWKASSSNETKDIVAGLQEVTTRGLYFQCILIALQKTNELMSFNQHIKQSFQVKDEADYFPHCSLLYGHLTKEQSIAYIQTLEKESEPVFKKLGEGSGIQFGSSNKQTKPMNTMTLGAIELWDTNGEVSDWRRINVVNLSEIR